MATAANRLYYDPAITTAFSTLRKLGVAVKENNNIKLDDIRDWLEKRFARNPYTVNNVMDVWEATWSTSGLSADLTTITNTFYPSLIYFPNFYTWSLYGQRQVHPLRRHLHQYSRTLVAAGVPSGCEQTRAKNS